MLLLTLSLLAGCDLSAPPNTANAQPMAMRRFASEGAACVAGGTFGAAQSLEVCEAAARRLGEEASDPSATRNALVFYHYCLQAAPDDAPWCGGYRASDGLRAAMWIKQECGEDSFCKLRMQEERKRCQPEAAGKGGIKNLPDCG